jgi:hypothetical protein
MHFNIKIFSTAGLLLATALFVSMTAMQQPQTQKERKFINLKVLPKHITERELNNVMGQWRRSLGVGCNFCHVRNEATNQMDFASDAKPEKLMARKMFLMAAKINKKYFDAKKDSLGMTMESSVSCNTCHRGMAHPEVALPPAPQRGQGAPQRGPGAAPQPDKTR